MLGTRKRTVVARRLVVEGDLLGDLQAGERLARAAGHDQLATVVGRRVAGEDVASLAARWCGRSVFLPVVGRKVSIGAFQSIADQSTLDSRRSLRPMRTTGTVQVVELIFSAVGPQSFAVEKIMPAGEPDFLPEAERKASMSPLLTRDGSGRRTCTGPRTTRRCGVSLGDDVDAVVVHGCTALGPVLPEVDLLEAIRELRRRAEVTGHEPLKGAALADLVGPVDVPDLVQLFEQELQP
jgi:hypothetical protein